MLITVFIKKAQKTIKLIVANFSILSKELPEKIATRNSTFHQVWEMIAIITYTGSPMK